MYEVNPFGERRQDIRSGRIGAYIVASHFAEVTDEAFAEMSSNLCNYLPCDQEHDGYGGRPGGQTRQHVHDGNWQYNSLGEPTA